MHLIRNELDENIDKLANASYKEGIGRHVHGGRQYREVIEKLSNASRTERIGREHLKDVEYPKTSPPEMRKNEFSLNNYSNLLWRKQRNNRDMNLLGEYQRLGRIGREKMCL